jgi:hypothetical protein
MSDDDSAARFLHILAQHYLMRQIGDYLHHEDVVALFLALPQPLRQKWLSPYHLAAWTRRQKASPHNGQFDHNEMLRRIEPTSRWLTLDTYLHVHPRMDHSRTTDGPWDQNDGGRIFVTDLFKDHNFTPQRPRVKVRACLFLPQRGPTRFLRGNLVVMGWSGQVSFYETSMVSYKLTASINLECAPDSLALSPGGSALLAGHVNSVWIDVSSTVIRCIFTGVTVHRLHTPHRIYSETAFLTGDYGGNVWMHQLEGGGRKRKRSSDQEIRVVTTLFVDSKCFGPKRWPFKSGGYGSISFLYKPSTPSTSDCIIFFDNTHDQGRGSLLRLKFAPHPQKTASDFDDVFIHFSRSVIASITVHPEHDFIYVVVMTKLLRKEFFAQNSWSPAVSTVGELCRDGQNWYGRIEHTVGVYELEFPEGRQVVVRPRFLLDGVDRNGVGSRLKHDLYKESEHYSRILIEARCGVTNLTIKLSDELLAHLPLISTAENDVVYHYSEHEFVEFAFSANLGFGILFEDDVRIYDHSKPLGLIACTKYQRFNRDVTSIKKSNSGFLVPVAPHQHPAY